MAYNPVESELGLQPITEVSTTQRHALGKEIRAVDPDRGEGTFVYLPGAASTVVGSWVTILRDTPSTVLLAADAIGPVGVAMSANVASRYGWYQIRGKASALTLASFLDNGRAYATATPGSVDDTVVDGDLVHNALGASDTNATTLLADFEIDRPYMDDIASND